MQVISEGQDSQNTGFGDILIGEMSREKNYIIRTRYELCKVESGKGNLTWPENSPKVTYPMSSDFFNPGTFLNSRGGSLVV